MVPFSCGKDRRVATLRVRLCAQGTREGKEQSQRGASPALPRCVTLAARAGLRNTPGPGIFWREHVLPRRCDHQFMELVGSERGGREEWGCLRRGAAGGLAPEALHEGVTTVCHSSALELQGPLLAAVAAARSPLQVFLFALRPSSAW